MAASLAPARPGRSIRAARWRRASNTPYNIASGAFVDSDGAVFFGINDNTTLSFTTVTNVAAHHRNLNGDSVSYTEGATPTLLDLGSNATVTDADSPGLQRGNVTVSITANRVAGEDVLGIQNQALPRPDRRLGSNVTFGGTTIGTFTGGTGTSDLVITFNASSSPAAAQALLHALTYSDSNTGDPSTTSRYGLRRVNDGDGGTSTASTVTVGVTAVNDAPVARPSRRRAMRRPSRSISA